MSDQEKLQKILDSALRILNIRPHSEKELKNKLLTKFAEEKELINEVIGDLKRTGLVNDQVFSEQYVNYRLSSAPRGRLLLKKELDQKGITSEVCGEILNEINEEELALEAANRKLKTFSAVPAEKKKEKLFRFLASRGFSSDVVYKTVKKVLG